MPFALAVSAKLKQMAFACAPASLTEKSQFFRPITLGRMALSAGLVSIATFPFPRKIFNSSVAWRVFWSIEYGASCMNCWVINLACTFPYYWKRIQNAFKGFGSFVVECLSVHSIQKQKQVAAWAKEKCDSCNDIDWNFERGQFSFPLDFLEKSIIVE